MKRYLSVPKAGCFESIVHLVLALAVLGSLLHFGHAMVKVSAGADRLASVLGQPRWIVIELDPESWQLRTTSVLASNAPLNACPPRIDCDAQRGKTPSVQPRAAAPPRLIQHGFGLQRMLRWLPAASGLNGPDCDVVQR